MIDRTVRTLIRRAPLALLRLAQVRPGEKPVQLADVTINLPEYRADHVFTLGADNDPGRWALYVEYQLQPDRRTVRGWFLRAAGLAAQLDLICVRTRQRCRPCSKNAS